MNLITAEEARKGSEKKRMEVSHWIPRINELIRLAMHDGALGVNYRMNDIPYAVWSGISSALTEAGYELLPKDFSTGQGDTSAGWHISWAHKEVAP